MEKPSWPRFSITRGGAGRGRGAGVFLLVLTSLLIGVSRQAVANESGLNFISVKGPELLNMVRSEDAPPPPKCGTGSFYPGDAVLRPWPVVCLCPASTWARASGPSDRSSRGAGTRLPASSSSMRSTLCVPDVQATR